MKDSVEGKLDELDYTNEKIEVIILAEYKRQTSLAINVW